MPYNTAVGYRRAIVGHTVPMHGQISYNSDLLLIAVCYDTRDLFHIIIHSYSELSSRENDVEGDVFHTIG